MGFVGVRSPKSATSKWLDGALAGLGLFEGTDARKLSGPIGRDLVLRHLG